MKKYDIFISYRRQGGYETARAVEASLSQRGYRVFLDVEGLRSGEFNKQLYQVIDQCKDVLVICSPHCLDRCVNEDDWVRAEIAHAIQTKKSIIPIIINDFQFPEPEALPEEIRSFPNYQALTPSPQTFSASMDILTKRYLKSMPVKKWHLPIALGCAVLALVLGFIGFHLFQQRPAISDTDLAVIDESCAYALGRVQYHADLCLTGLKACGQYLDGEMEERYLKEALSLYQSEMKQYPLSASSTLRVDYDGADFCTELADQAEGCGCYSRYLDFARWLVLESPKSDSARHAVLDSMEKLVHQEYLNALNRVFGAFLPIENRFERKSSGDYRFSTIYLVYSNGKKTVEIANDVHDSLFANSNDTIRPEQIYERINGSTAPYEREIEHVVGNIWKEMTQKEDK